MLLGASRSYDVTQSLRGYVRLTTRRQQLDAVMSVYVDESSLTYRERLFILYCLFFAGNNV